MLEPSGVGPALPSRKCNSISDDDSGCALDEYSWLPQGLSPHQVHEYMNSLPKTKIPYSGLSGEKQRIRQLLRQLPPQDSKASYCSGLSNEERNEFYLFQNSRKRDALGRGTVGPVSDSSHSRFCVQCHEKLTPRELVIFASRAGQSISWHPGCFVCCVCKETLVDLIYFYKDGRIYCGRHHAETLKPRCVTCDEIIFADECTEAEGFSWHMRHFACFECNQLLGGQQYIMRDGRPFCCPCFELLYADCCESCGKIIGVEDGRMTHDGHQWHATDLCFSCRSCGLPLKHHSFMLNHSELYCSANCMTRVAASNRPEKVINHSRKQIVSLRGLTDDSLPEDSVSWTSLSNREDQSSVSTYSELNFKWKTGSQCSDDPGPHDCHSLAETDSGLNLTFATSMGHISENDQNRSTDRNPSTSSIEAFDQSSRKSVNAKIDRIRSAPVGCNSSKSRREQFAEKATICPTNYMINPEKYFLNSPSSDSESLPSSFSPQQASPSPSVPANYLHSCTVVSPVPSASGRHGFNRLSPVNEICASELNDCGAPTYSELIAPNAISPTNLQGRSTTKNQVNSSVSAQMELCKSCRNVYCNCSTKASLPDLSYTTIACETKWKQNPFVFLKRNSSSKTPNQGTGVMTAVGGRRASGYDSDSALKRRRIKQHHKRATDITSNSSHQLPKLGVGELSNCATSEFRPTLSSHRQSTNCRKVTDWSQFRSDQMSTRLAKLDLQYDACSTCSSSSGSEFDYYLDRPYVQSLDSAAASGNRLKKRKNKQCIIS